MSQDKEKKDMEDAVKVLTDINNHLAALLAVLNALTLTVQAEASRTPAGAPPWQPYTPRPYVTPSPISPYVMPTTCPTVVPEWRRWMSNNDVTEKGQ